MNKKALFVVDDRPDVTGSVAHCLQSEFFVCCLSSGREALDKLHEVTPAILLINIRLPDMDGYQLCREIKESDPGDTMSVIFLSGTESPVDCEAGFNAGADDYLVGDFDASALLMKVNAVLHFQRDKQALREKEKFSREMAFQSMGEASQYGAVLQFVKTAAVCKTTIEIAQGVNAICKEFSLNSCVQIREQEVLCLRAGGGTCSPIEHQLFELLSTQGRVYAFNNRYMFNDKHLSILITNMPIDDESRSGRLNDLMATVVEAAESAIVSLARLNSLKTLLGTTEATLTRITDAYSTQKSDTIAVMDKMMFRMEEALSTLGLTEEQETFFLALAESTQETLLRNFVDAHLIERDLGNIVKEIKKRVEGEN
jgi:DNA-binding response OmpR family regulator